MGRLPEVRGYPYWRRRIEPHPFGPKKGKRMETRSEYRFSSEDETKIRARIESVWGDYRPVPTKSGEVRETLRRIGAHSIGCTLDDFRAVEIAWLDDLIDGL